MNKRRRYKAKALRRAQNARSCVIRISQDSWDAFTAALDSPPAPNEALKRLMCTCYPWEGIHAVDCAAGK